MTSVKKVAVESYVLNHVDASSLHSRLMLDASDYYYSAWMSVLDALRAIECGFFTWSTVKMYYSVFYALRSIIAWDNNTALFHPRVVTGGKIDEGGLYRIEAKPGKSPKLLTGAGTHKPLLAAFKELNKGHFLVSQEIDLMPALAWMIKRREAANYKMSRFSEPSVPQHFQMIDKLGVRQAVAAYLDPKRELLAFDKDHAIVAFPLAALRLAGKCAVSHGGIISNDEELDFINSKCRGVHGSLDHLLRSLKSTMSHN